MLLINGGRVPPRWLEKKNPSSALSDAGRYRDCINLALINNMPDSALEDTEMQFFELLDAACGDLRVDLKLFSLSGVPRGERAQQHLDSFYCSTDELWHTQLDGIIMTGTEPRQPDLRQEPYWGSLVNVLNWAKENTISTVLSCLAAHAGVLATDGIERHRLPDKQFGVFQFTKGAPHELTLGTADIVRFPHSRWNEVRAEDLLACGYTVLTQSANAGVDAFAKKRRKSLFVHFQGHPEYGEQTLFKEYRRDIRRFLHHERDTYPSMPQGYFDQEATGILLAYRDRALASRGEEIISAFPDAIVDRLQNRWRSSALCIYRNWLGYIDSRRTEVSSFPVMAEVFQGQRIRAERKRSARP